jgi:hypothetical protein
MQLQDQNTLDFYQQPGVLTSAGAYVALFDDLPGDIPGLVAVGQGLLIHEHLAPAYDVTLSDEDRASVHIRSVAKLLERIIATDDRPLTTARAAGARVAVNCRHFSVLMVAMLRAQGTPARARCGFGGYFGTGAFEDHWACEYWQADKRRWALVDSQVDSCQCSMFPIDFDLTDVPEDRFVRAGQAWQQYRAGVADPAQFGLTMLKEAGDWWIAANLMRDAAALNNMELLPWDCWGAMPGPDDPIDDERLALFDGLARLTQAPDDHFNELQRLYQDDDRVRVPAVVFSAARQRLEEV